MINTRVLVLAMEKRRRDIVWTLCRCAPAQIAVQCFVHVTLML